MSINSLSAAYPVANLPASQAASTSSPTQSGAAGSTSAATQTTVSSVASTVSALTTLVRQSTDSQELSSLGSAAGTTAGVQTSLSVAFSKLLTNLAADKSPAAKGTESSAASAINSLVSNSLRTLQNGGASSTDPTGALGSIINTTA